MSQPPIPFSSSFNSLTLNVTTGTSPNQVTHTQAITSVFQGNNSFPITDANILTAFNSQPLGTSFTSSIVAEYGSDGNGNALKTVSTPSVASFIPRPPPPLYDVTDQYFHVPDVYNPIDNADPYNYEGYLGHTIYCAFTTRALEPSNGYRYGYKISYALASNQSTEYVVWNDAPAEGNGLDIYIGTLPELQLKSNTAYVAIITLIDRDTKEELTNLQPKQVFTYTTPGSILLHPNGKTIRAIGTFDDLYAEALANNNINSQNTMFFQANPRGTGMEWFTVIYRGVDVYYGNKKVYEVIHYLEKYARNIEPSAERDAVVAAFTPPGQSEPVPIRNLIMSLVTSMAGWLRFAINPDIESWDVYNVKNFSFMFFQGNSEWNQNINHWDVTRGRNFNGMFKSDGDTGLRLFNQPLNNWTPVQATDIRELFQYNSNVGSPYQQDLSMWYFNNFGNGLNIGNIPYAFNGFPKERIPAQIAATMP